MNIQKIFPPLKRLELGLAELYRRYSDYFSYDPEAALIFMRLSLDERSHAALLDYQRRLVKTNPTLFGEVELDLKAVVEMADRVCAMNASSVPELGAAVSAALRFEASASEYHYRSAIMQANPSVARLMGCLGRSDHSHKKELLEFARARNYLDEPCLPSPGTGFQLLPVSQSTV